MGYLFIALTVAFTVYGQLVLKWRVNQAGWRPDESASMFAFVLHMLLDPWVLSGFAAAFLASLAWMAAMTRFELSYAYPFMSLNFVAVLLLSAWFFGEPITAHKVIGLVLIGAGIIVGSRGYG